MPAQPESMADARQTQEYKVRNFDGLDISWSYKVELTRSNRYSVSVEAPDFVLPYLRIEVRGDVLCLETRDMPRDGWMGRKARTAIAKRVISLFIAICFLIVVLHREGRRSRP